MDHETFPFSDTEMPKAKLIAKFVDICFKSSPR